MFAVAAVAGLAGTDEADAPGVRLLFAWPSVCCEIDAGEWSILAASVAALISSFPGSCRFVDTGVAGVADAVPLGSPLSSFLDFFCGLISVSFLLVLTLIPSLVNASAVDRLLSSFRGGFFCAD